MLIAQQQQEQNEISLENQHVIDNINAAQSQDTSSSDNSGSSGSSGGSSKSSDNQDEQKNIFPGSHDKNLGSDSHLVIMKQQDEDGKGSIGLYTIISDEKDLDTHVLPQTIRLVNTFETVEEAVAWLSQYDARNN